MACYGIDLLFSPENLKGQFIQKTGLFLATKRLANKAWNNGIGGMSFDDVNQTQGPHGRSASGAQHGLQNLEYVWSLHISATLFFGCKYDIICL